MTLVVLASAKGAPGVTTAALALALAWPLYQGRPVLLVDADPAGADLAAGYLQGATGPGGGLAAVAGARVDPEQAVLGAALALDATGDRLLLTAPSPAPVTEQGPSWSVLSRLPARDWVVMVDAGRVTAGTAEAAKQLADVVVLVTGASLREAAAARPVASALAATDARPAVLLVVGERRPYSSDELSASLGLAALPALAWDPRAAAVLSDGARPTGRFARTALMRSAASTARALHDRLAAAADGMDGSSAAAEAGAGGTALQLNGHAAVWGVRP